MPCLAFRLQSVSMISSRWRPSIVIRLSNLAALATLSLGLALIAPCGRADDLPVEIAEALEARNYAVARAELAILVQNGSHRDAHFRYATLLLNGLGGPVDLTGGKAHLEAALAQDHAPAGVLLARMLMTGGSKEIARDTVQAADILRRAASLGDAEAHYYLGLLEIWGEGVDQNIPTGLGNLEIAAAGGFILAQMELANVYSRGNITPKDMETATQWLKAAAEGGNAEAQYSLANALDVGQGVARDEEAALTWYRRAAEQGVPIAQRALGNSYLIGARGVEPNPAEAERWLTQAARQGDPGAMFNLAVAYTGANGFQRNDGQAFAWMKAAADQELPRAVFGLGQLHEEGRGTEIDVRAAALLYRDAYELGDERGGLRLGILTGQGALADLVPPHLSVPWALAAAMADDAGAQSWLEQQAEDGLRGAQAAFGVWLLDTDGPAAQAAQWFEKAAEKGDPTAQHRLGLLYMTGHGVDLDYEVAHKWLNIAATNGVSAAAETRAIIGDLMTPEQVAAAQAQARAFFANAAPPATLQDGNRP